MKEFICAFLKRMFLYCKPMGAQLMAERLDELTSFEYEVKALADGPDAQVYEFVSKADHSLMTLTFKLTGECITGIEFSDSAEAKHAA